VAREVRQLLDIDHYVAMLDERFGHRFGGDWPIEIDGRTEMVVGVVDLGPADIDWIDEQTPPAARRLVHPRAVRHSLDDLHRYDDALFARLADLEADQLVDPGWTCAVDVDENRVVVVLATPIPDPTEHLTDQAPADAVAVVTRQDAGTRVRRLVAPKRHERSAGARALGAAMTVVGEIVHGRNADTETEVVAEAPDGEPPLDLDFGGLDPLD
jgi:hypothetical protein